MTSDTRLKLSGVMFAVLWTAGMWWWVGPRDAVEGTMLVVAGTIAGFLWYWIWKKLNPRMYGGQG